MGGGLTVGQHVRNMLWTAGPALAVSLVAFLVLGRAADPDADVSTDAARAALAEAFDISALNLLPLALLVVLAILRMPPFLSILGSAVFAAVLAPVPAVGRGGGLRRRPEPRARWRPRSRRGTPPWPPGS